MILERPDGSRLTVVMNIRALKNERGEITGAINCFYDISERKQAEETKAKLAAIIESSDDAIIGKDLNSVITSWNWGAERLFGYTAQEAIGRPITMLIPPDRLDEEPKILEQLKRGETVDHFETVRVRKDGSKLEISLTISPIKDSRGRVIGASKIARNISRRKRADEARRILTQQLSHETKRARDYAEATLRTSPVPLLVLEKDLRVKTANEAFYETFHVQPAMTEGNLVYELGNGQWDIPKLRQLLEDILPRHTVFKNFEVTHDFETIGRRTMLLNARRMENEAGTPERVVLVIEDITERKQTEEDLRESEARFRMMADNITQLAWICDQLGNVTWYNRRWLDYTGLTFEEMRDWGWKKVHHPDHVDRVVASVTRSRESGEVWDDTFPLRGKDGKYRWFLSRAVPIKDPHGNILRWFGTNTDITEQRNSEEALRRAHELLTNEARLLEALVQERTASLQETIAELEHFSYTITHDMRAPLRAMQGFGGMLLEDPGNSLTPESVDSLKRIVDAAQRMDALIRDSLQYAKVVREQPPLGPVEPGPILSTILRSYPSLQPPGVEIQVIEPLPAVMAAETGLAQCFSNLLVNAVKFVKPGITPRVRIWAEIRQQSNPRTVRFWFEDNGIGIPSQYQARIFDMFQQLDKNYEGTGIGLALVRKTVERMKGKVGVESEPGKGSRFWLELPSASRA